MPLDAPSGPDQLRKRIAEALPARDLSTARVAVGLGIAALGLVAWFLLGSSDEAKAPEETLQRATTSVAAPSDGGPPAAADWVVQVSGAVSTPGVVRVGEGSRVGDAIDEAGGAAPDADLDRINLAAKVSDGQRIYVLRKGEQAPPAVLAGDGSGSGDADAGPMDINSASAAALDELPGVGPATAKAIVDYRTKSGPFRSVEDLAKVKGIGPAKLEQIKPLVRV